MNTTIPDINKKEATFFYINYNLFDNIDTSKKQNILLVGNLIGIFGAFNGDGKNKYKYCIMYDKDIDSSIIKVHNNRFSKLIELLKNDSNITIVCDTEMYYYYYIPMFTYLKNNKYIKFNYEKQVDFFLYDKYLVEKESEKFLSAYFNKQILTMKMKYDYIIQNPPYSGSLHLEFLKKGLELLKDNSGKMTIIEPATFLISLLKKGKATTLYPEIKNILNNHVYKVVIENLNLVFNTANDIPFAITYVDFSKEYNNIEYYNCGYKYIVNSLDDCNLVGNYNIIQDIFNKVKQYGNMMRNHIYNNKSIINNDTYYCKYSNTLLGTGTYCNIETPQTGGHYEYNSFWNSQKNGDYLKLYLTSCYHYYNNEISNKILCKYDSGKHLTDKPAECLYATKEELENWKYFIFNNKLPLFLNILVSFSRTNNSKDIIPWLTDKQYTDEEINKLFNFTNEEIRFIDKTLKKYERHSPWFRRYICGKDSVPDEEVQEFMDKLNKEYNV